MNEANESRYHTGDTLCDALRFLSDASYAILPRDVAYKIAEKKMGWIDEALRGGDRLREEWQRRYDRPPETQTTTPPPPDGMG